MYVSASWCVWEWQGKGYIHIYSSRTQYLLNPELNRQWINFPPLAKQASRSSYGHRQLDNWKQQELNKDFEGEKKIENRKQKCYKKRTTRPLSLSWMAIINFSLFTTLLCPEQRRQSQRASECCLWQWHCSSCCTATLSSSRLRRTAVGQKAWK